MKFYDGIKSSSWLITFKLKKWKKKSEKLDVRRWQKKNIIWKAAAVKRVNDDDVWFYRRLLFQRVHVS